MQRRNREGSTSGGHMETGKKCSVEDNVAQNESIVKEGHEEPSDMINGSNMQEDTISPSGNAKTDRNSKFTNNELKQDDNKSFASIVKEQMEKSDNKLDFIPPDMNENGDEIAIFDEKLVAEGLKRWKMIVSSYFVGTQMSIYEVRYNVRRMWGRYGLEKVYTNGNGFYFFKFKNKECVQYVAENGPWMINNKHMIVQE
ncbi:RNA-directed DNA polymerase, eukaryota, reverse transcriptase zinc-binding domain protein [Tanacetum coccineum]|uniref:RNA-directed DNA polymerase, eukaryota, reverse transcriptase zinc-binding domain protein n=1 Tax=Tanacetum coccineum TaxID=301880 RepID=A0ABQ4WBX6_9ASTR